MFCKRLLRENGRLRREIRSLRQSNRELERRFGELYAKHGELVKKSRELSVGSCHLEAMVENLREELRDAAAAKSFYQEIVDKLPRTKDGVPITPGMTLYLASPTSVHELVIDGRYMMTGPCCWYSTPEAAIQAENKREHSRGEVEG